MLSNLVVVDLMAMTKLGHAIYFNYNILRLTRALLIRICKCLASLNARSW